MGGIEPEYAIGPEGEDWRVPVSELQARLRKFSQKIANQGLNYALIQTPVDLYYFTGSRQNGTLVIFSDSEKAPIYFVRRSLNRALWECGGTDCPIEIKQFPRMKDFPDVLTTLGCRSRTWNAIRRITSLFCRLFYQEPISVRSTC